MKRIIAIALVLLIALGTVACGAKNEPVTIDTANKYVGKPVADLVAAIGEPKDSTYQDSCELPDAQDGFWHYEGFTVTTLKQESGETVRSVKAS